MKEEVSKELKCIRCCTDMVNSYPFDSIENNVHCESHVGHFLYIRVKQGFLCKECVRIIPKTFICPKCGYVELRLTDTQLDVFNVTKNKIQEGLWKKIDVL